MQDSPEGFVFVLSDQATAIRNSGKLTALITNIMLAACYVFNLDPSVITPVVIFCTAWWGCGYFLASLFEIHPQERVGLCTKAARSPGASS